MNRIGKRIAVSLLVSFVIYIVIAFTLVYWPIPTEKNTETYDFSSIDENSDSPLGVEQWIKARDGAELFARVYKSESKNVLILIHGSGSESRYLSSLANSIAGDTIATVLTPDLRGHGENKGPRGDIEYMGQLEDDIEDLIDYSRKNLGAEKIILAGHSSGGGMVLRYIGNPENTKVDKAIMLAPYLGYDAPAVKPNSGGWVTVALKRIVGLSMLNNIRITYLNGLPVLFFNRPAEYEDRLQVPSYSFRMTLNFTSEDYKKDVKKINIPCLVLVGGQDESFYPEQFSIAFEPAEKFVETEILAEANHLNLVSNKKTFERIKEWMKGN